MKNATEQVKETREMFSAVDWSKVAADLHAKGFAWVSQVLPRKNCDEFIDNYDKFCYRKTVTMERHRFGLGEYKYFDYPLPDLVQTAREEIYPILAPVANIWMDQLRVEKEFPETFGELQALCHKAGQTKPTPLILKYAKGGFNTMHQDLYGEVFFPIQLAFFLDEPDVDYTGGEFVLTEQIPRSQSRAIVLRPRKGDMVVFTTNFQARERCKRLLPDKR